MRALKLIVHAVALLVVLPIVIVGVLGFLFSPLQTTARATEPRTVMEANDLMLSEAVKSQMEQSEETAEQEGEQKERQEEPQAYEAEPEETIELVGLSEEATELVGLSEEAAESESNASPHSSSELCTQGVIDDGGYRYTWYSQRVLPGGGLDIEGRHVSDEGYVVDAQNRIVVASSDLPYGTEIAIPFGDGKAVVLDTGCASGVLDIYTDFFM